MTKPNPNPKVRVKDPESGLFHWVDRSQLGAPDPTELPPPRRARTTRPAVREVPRHKHNPKREGMFDDAKNVDDWDLDDL